MLRFLISGQRCRGSWGLDAVLMLATLAAGAWLGHGYLRAVQPKTIVEWELAPAVMVACGHGFSSPSAESPALTAFLVRQRASIACEDLAGSGVAPATPVALSERYAITMAGIALRVRGMSWDTIDAYVGGLFGVSMALAYAIFRLLAGPGLAVAGVIALAWSHQLPALMAFRDYGKQPAFYALFLALGWLILRGHGGASRRLYVPAAVAGVIVGIGLGFRVDVLVFVPACLAVMVFGVPGWDRAALRVKGAAAALFLASGLVTGAPILASMSEGSNSAHVIVLGLLKSYNRTLGIDAAPYDLGDTYSDSYAYAIISAHADLVEHDDDPVPYGTADYDRAGSRLLADMVRTFPADVTVRVLAATAQTLRFPFDDHARGLFRGVEPIHSSSVLSKIGEWRYHALGLVEGYELTFALLVLLAVAVQDWRLGVLGAVLTLYFCGYSMLQFSRRHTFHLDLVPIGLTVLAVHLAGAGAWAVAVRSRGRTLSLRPSSHVFHGVVAVFVMAGVLGAGLQTLRWWQQRRVTGLVERAVTAQWQTLPTSPEPLSDTAMRDGAPVLTWTTIFANDPARWASAALLRIERPAVPPRAEETGRLQVEYLQVEIGASCPASVVSVGLKYTSVNEAYWEFTRVLDVPVEPGPRPSRLLVPAFYQDGPDWTRFDGFAVPAAHADCIVRVGRAVDPRRLPLPILYAVLPPSWRDQPLYQRLQSPPQFTSADTPVHGTRAVDRP